MASGDAHYYLPKSSVLMPVGTCVVYTSTNRSLKCDFELIKGGDSEKRKKINGQWSQKKKKINGQWRRRALAAPLREKVLASCERLERVF